MQKGLTNEDIVILLNYSSANTENENTRRAFYENEKMAFDYYDFCGYGGVVCYRGGSGNRNIWGFSVPGEF